MEPHILQAGSIRHGSEAIFYAPLRHGPADLISEYQAVSIVPQRAGSELLFNLLPALDLQSSQHGRSSRHGPGLVVLGRGEQFPGFPLSGRRQLLIDGDRAFVEVHGIPGKAQQLTHTHTSEERHRDKLLQFPACSGLQQHGNFFVRERMDLLLLLPGQGAALDGVPGDIVQLHRLFQRFTQNTADQAHSSRGTVYAVDEALNSVGVEVLEPDRSQGRLDVEPDIVLVVADGGGFHCAQVVRLPHIQPLPNCHALRCGIGALVDLHHAD